LGLQDYVGVAMSHGPEFLAFAIGSLLSFSGVLIRAARMRQYGGSLRPRFFPIQCVLHWVDEATVDRWLLSGAPLRAMNSGWTAIPFERRM
jgi:hypothetical protein